MKRLLFTTGLLIQVVLLCAQSIEDGKKHLFNERYASAETAFHTVIGQDPANAEAWFWLTRSYLLQHDSTTATDTLSKAPQAIKEDPYYLVAKGAILLNAGNKEEANASFNKAIDETKGKNVDILAAIADTHIDADNGEVTVALDLLQKAKKRDKKSAAILISEGKAYRKKHDGTLAYQSFMEAIDKDKQAAEAYYELGKIFKTQKNEEMFTSYFNKAIEANKNYAPAYYALYDHYLYKDPAKAMQYFQQYATNADKDVQQLYSYTDLLYLNKKYDSAITIAKDLIEREGSKVQPRLYKLVAYSYEGKEDSATAFNFMQQYFSNENDSNFVVKDYETMANLYASKEGRLDSAMAYYEKAVALASDPKQKNKYYQTLAKLAKSANDNIAEAKWLGNYYLSDPAATNITLFNWGIAAYKAKDYHQADSAFRLYTTKYPKQGFGYYWRARSNAAKDSAMELGLAVEHYQKLISVINKDSMTANDKKWIGEAYGYLATYETNTKKDYAEAVTYFERLLEYDPENEQAKKYIDILEKNIEAKTEKSAENKEEKNADEKAGTSGSK
jgi:tetratricopeptide (TPR) repeat protein